MLLAGLVIALLLISVRAAVSPFVSTEGAESDGFVRVEVASQFGRGRDPGEVARHLREAGVPVEVRRQRTWLPWQSGQLLSYSFTTGNQDWAPGEGARADRDDLLEADFADAGVVSWGDGTLVLDPERFDGKVRLDVGELSL